MRAGSVGPARRRGARSRWAGLSGRVVRPRRRPAPFGASWSDRTARGHRLGAIVRERRLRPGQRAPRARARGAVLRGTQTPSARRSSRSRPWASPTCAPAAARWCSACRASTLDAGTLAALLDDRTVIDALRLPPAARGRDAGPRDPARNRSGYRGDPRRARAQREALAERSSRFPGERCKHRCTPLRAAGLRAAQSTTVRMLDRRRGAARGSPSAVADLTPKTH